MSALNRVKGIILHEMKGSNQELKRAVTKIINAIDSDLDVEGYVQSSDVDEAFSNLDEVLIKLDEPVKQPDDESDLVFTSRKKITREENEE